jgi:hypothetical protein
VPIVDREADEQVFKIFKKSMEEIIFDRTHPLWNWREELTEDEKLTLKFSRLYESCFDTDLGTATSRYVHLICKMDSLLERVRLWYGNRSPFTIQGDEGAGQVEHDES